MVRPAGAAFSAGDATVETADHQPEDRPLTDNEREYLVRRADDTAEAVKHIKTLLRDRKRQAKGDDDAARAAESMIPGLEQALAAAEDEAASAKQARRAV